MRYNLWMSFEVSLYDFLVARQAWKKKKKKKDRLNVF